MHSDGKIESGDVKNVYTHTRMQYHVIYNIHLSHCHMVMQMTFRAVAAVWAETPQILIEERRVLFATNVSPDTLLCQFGMDGSHLLDF
jgi:hypothetical protein